MFARPCSFETVSLFALCVFLSGACFGAERSDVAIDAVIAAPPAHSAGIWRTKSQPVFDPAERTLIRRMYMVWDPMPERGLDFVWIPSALRDDKEGKVNGVGRLIWRVKGKPAYDPASIFAEYRGVMRDGRADGEGTYFDTTGMSYKGSWKAGLMDGLGTLMLPGGDEYIGQMRAGKAHGAGRYIEVTGEIFDGSFVEGKREGIGTTTLPDGSSYRSRWVQGQETEDSRRVRLAQSGGQLAQAGGGDVRIGIWVDKSKARERGDLVYAASSSGAQLMIQPDNPRLMSMWKGNGEIELKDDEEGQTSEYGVFSLNRGQLLPLTLVVEVQNRSAMPIAVAGAYLAVGSSVSDLQPAIQLNRALTICAEAPYKPTFRAENFGWGPAENAEMHFGFANPNLSGQPHPDVAKRVGNIVRTVNIDLEPELRAAGVDTAKLAASSKSGFVCRSGLSKPACLEQVKSTGIFGSIASQVGLRNDTSDIYVSARGTLDYNWRGGSQTRSSPYNVLLPLGHIKIEAECGEGGEREVVAANALQLRLDQTGYRLPISFQRSIPAGRTSQYEVTLKAAKSSQHDFTVVLQLADGREISSRPVNLVYYLPSWFWGK